VRETLDGGASLNGGKQIKGSQTGTKRHRESETSAENAKSLYISINRFLSQKFFENHEATKRKDPIRKAKKKEKKRRKKAEPIPEASLCAQAS
jgi:hypothetical protein